MANEIVKNENVEVTIIDEVKDLVDYNVKIGEDVIGLQIKCKRIKDDKKCIDFNSVKGMLFIPVYELNKKGDPVYVGDKNRWLDVHFTKVAFKGVPNECDVHSPEDLTTGTLYIRLKGIQIPSKYVVTKDEDGKDVYPEIWVKNSIVGFVPYTPDKDMFKYHKPEKVIEYDQETGEVKDDDPETQSFTDGE